MGIFDLNVPIKTVGIKFTVAHVLHVCADIIKA